MGEAQHASLHLADFTFNISGRLQIESKVLCGKLVDHLCARCAAGPELICYNTDPFAASSNFREHNALIALLKSSHLFNS